MKSTAWELSHAQYTTSKQKSEPRFLLRVFWGNPIPPWPLSLFNFSQYYQPEYLAWRVNKPENSGLFCRDCWRLIGRLSEGREHRLLTSVEECIFVESLKCVDFERSQRVRIGIFVYWRPNSLGTDRAARQKSRDKLQNAAINYRVTTSMSQCILTVTRPWHYDMIGYSRLWFPYMSCAVTFQESCRIYIDLMLTLYQNPFRINCPNCLTSFNRRQLQPRLSMERI